MFVGHLKHRFLSHSQKLYYRIAKLSTVNNMLTV